MELTNPASVNPEFSEPTETNIDGLTMINIRQGGKKLIIPTGKCFSFGVRKDVKFGTVTMSIVLDETTVEVIEKVIFKAEKHLGKRLSKVLYRRKDGTTTIHAKLEKFKSKILTKFYQEEKEIDPMIYEGKHCEVKAALLISGISVREDKANLQVKVYEAMVKEKKYERVRLLDMKW